MLGAPARGRYTLSSLKSLIELKDMFFFWEQLQSSLLVEDLLKTSPRTKLHSCKLASQWKIDPLKMHLLVNMVIFQLAMLVY